MPRSRYQPRPPRETPWLLYSRRPRLLQPRDSGLQIPLEEPGRDLGNIRPAASPPDQLLRPAQDLSRRARGASLSALVRRHKPTAASQDGLPVHVSLALSPIGSGLSTYSPETREICINEREGNASNADEERGLQVGSGRGGNPWADVTRVQPVSDLRRKVCQKVSSSATLGPESRGAGVSCRGPEA